MAGGMNTMKHQTRKKALLYTILFVILGMMIGQATGISLIQAQGNTAAHPQAATVDEWPMFHHDLSHSGYTTADAPGTATMLWTFYTGAEVSSSPTIVGDRVYIGSWDKKVYCLNATTGAKIWDYQTGLEVGSSPAVSNGRVYIGSNDYKLYCLDAETGTKLWDYVTGAEVSSSPAVVGDSVYVGSRDHKVYCLNVTTGQKNWDYTTGMDIISSPAVVDGKVYVGSWDDKVYCIDAATGAYVWSYQTGNDVYSSPAVADGKVFIGSSDSKLYCLDAQTGAWIWDSLTGASIESGPAVHNGRVYVGSFDHKMYCLDETTGSEIWNYQANDYFYSSPAIADGKLYASAFDNKFYCLDAETGNLIWTYGTGYMNWASPAVVDGRLYLASGNHVVYCFKDSQPETPAAPEGPTAGFTTVPYQFTAVTTDPQGNHLYYMFSWGDGTNSSWTGPYPSGSIANATHAWTTPGNYSVSVKAKNTDGVVTDWSPAHNIAIAQAPTVTIQTIAGGFLTAKATVKNTGSIPTGAIDFRITCGGKSQNGTIPSLEPGAEQTIHSRPAFGLGKTTISVTITWEGGSATMEQQAFILLIYIITKG
jgi:hypothetical protein